MVVAAKLPDQVYTRLLGEILSGRLESGAVLRETELSERLGVSRTPVREALGRLAAADLVELARNRSAVVRKLLPEQLRHIYQLREALEGLAAERACGRLTPDDLARLDELARAIDPNDCDRDRAACHRFDVELHRLIAERSGNPLLAREIGKYHDLVQLVRERVGNRDGGLALAFRQHVQIIEALREGDPAACHRAMVEHIRSSGALAVRCAAENTDQNVSGSEKPGESPR